MNYPYSETNSQHIKPTPIGLLHVNPPFYALLPFRRDALRSNYIVKLLFANCTEQKLSMLHKQMTS